MRPSLPLCLVTLAGLAGGSPGMGSGPSSVRRNRDSRSCRASAAGSTSSAPTTSRWAGPRVSPRCRATRGNVPGAFWGVRDFGVDQEGHNDTAAVDNGGAQKFTPRTGANPAMILGKPLRAAWK